MTTDPRAGNCWHCGQALGPLDYGRADTCSRCGKHTKACRGCQHYDPGSNNDCRETQAERVVDKERSNFCDYFRPAARPGSGAPAREALKAAAEALFKKK